MNELYILIHIYIATNTNTFLYLKFETHNKNILKGHFILQLSTSVNDLEEKMCMYDYGY